MVLIIALILTNFTILEFILSMGIFLGTGLAVQ
jgi:hypothetical protein